jgi:basic membrane lipoprotein Med (substrate-binding protein (PBP1-ABC) superfamily)
LAAVVVKCGTSPGHSNNIGVWLHERRAEKETGAKKGQKRAKNTDKREMEQSKEKRSEKKREKDLGLHHGFHLMKSHKYT